MLGKEMIALLEQTKYGCSHNCQECGLHINNKCFYEWKKEWEKWNKESKKVNEQ